VINSPRIVKVGVGVNTDFPVIWNDLGSDMNNVVDCGLMAKLLFAEKYRDSHGVVHQFIPPAVRRGHIAPHSRQRITEDQLER
jgi:hypothetical protein